MGFQMQVADYLDYIAKVAQRIADSRDYITELDAATGDGDHWANINMGFQELLKNSDSYRTLSFSDMFKQMGMKMMNAIGGSSGILYGSAYLGAAKVMKDRAVLDAQALCDVLDAMAAAMMKRGNSAPGQKTMLDAIVPAVDCFKAGLAAGADEAELLRAVGKAATEGALSTKDMEAVRGRACYQANKGVGHLDPGAMTMAYQIETLTEQALSL